MDPIKGASAVDYAMTVPQNQNQIQGYEDYSSMPMVYEPEIAEKKKLVLPLSELSLQEV